MWKKVSQHYTVLSAAWDKQFAAFARGSRRRSLPFFNAGRHAVDRAMGAFCLIDKNDADIASGSLLSDSENAVAVDDAPKIVLILNHRLSRLGLPVRGCHAAGEWQLLYRVGQAMNKAYLTFYKLDGIFHAILVSITARQGLGFNHAFLALFSPSGSLCGHAPVRLRHVTAYSAIRELDRENL